MRHRDDTIVICQLVCVIDSWAHTSFVHSILSLKLGVTLKELLLKNNLMYIHIDIEIDLVLYIYRL